MDNKTRYLEISTFITAQKNIGFLGRSGFSQKRLQKLVFKECKKIRARCNSQEVVELNITREDYSFKKMKAVKNKHFDEATRLTDLEQETGVRLFHLINKIERAVDSYETEEKKDVLSFINILFFKKVK